MALAIAVILLVVGTVAFHLWNPWWLTPIASNWTQIDDTLGITFWVTGVVFVAVNLFMAYAIIRYRHREGVSRRAEYEPESKKLEWSLTAITALGVAAMLAPGLAVWAKFVTVPADADVVEAIGQQWAWSFRLPGNDGKLGGIDPALVSEANPFGMIPGDPAGRDDVLVNGPELHLPLGRPVKVVLRSKDVLHDFTVAQFRVKMDMVPGMLTYLWLTPTRTGTFDILCEELCGLGHFAMRGRVVVDDAGAYETWRASQHTFAQVLEKKPGDASAGQATFAVCMSCHGGSGEGNEALHAPKLAGQASWYLARQLHNFKGGARGAAPGDVIAAQMRAIALTLDDDAIDNVVAYIGTLPDTRAVQSIQGDASRGAVTYRTCAYCHGAGGRGIWSTNAPRLAGMSDWYLLRQLENFHKGLRGKDPQDIYGAQMALIGQSLTGENAHQDVIAYIDGLQ